MVTATRGLSPTPDVHTRAYRDGAIVAEGFSIGAISDQLADGATCVWVDLVAPDGDDLHTIASELGLHELAVEDALSVHQRPKLDRYASHMFVSTHTVELDPDAVALRAARIDAFVAERWVVTVRPAGSFEVAHLTERWDRAHHLSLHGSDFLLHGLLDLVVDSYLAAADAFDEYFDELSDGLFDEKPLTPGEERRLLAMRRALTGFGRLARSTREVVHAVVRREEQEHLAPLDPYFADVLDHATRAAETADVLRDSAAAIVETNIGLRDYQQNVVVKRVTSWAAIIAVPTLVTGFYGMNVPYPGSGTSTGVWTAVALIVVPAAALYVVFKRRGWL